MANYETIKILLIGTDRVGKTSLISRFSDDIFTDTYVATIGIDFKIKSIELDGKKTKFQLWDTAGQERFLTITNSYYGGANGIIIVYDVTNPESFDNVPKCLRDVERYAREDVSKLIVGNKCDLNAEKRVDYTTAKEFGDSMGISVIEASAKDITNVEEVFMTMAVEIKKKRLEAVKPTHSDAACRCTLQ